MTKKILVTSALPYVNNLPHLGTMVCVLSADVYTRFLRLKGENVISVCGTDEHGTTTETKALEEGLTPRQITDKYYKLQKEIYDWFNCDFDCFGRTSSKPNKEVTIDIFKKLDKNGFIKEDILEQTFCKKCNKFLADRFVEGECPFCNYKEARGDQCEHCGKLLNATELINAKCKICSSTPEVKETHHLFIDLPKLEPQLKSWIKTVEKNWSENARTMTYAWLKEGIKPRCITRDLKWGIPVPKKGYEDKVFYSWFDAPIGYIGITKEHKPNWQNWWKNNKDVKLVQFMGKDNIPFHTILFPGFLIGTKDPYTLVRELSVNEYLNYESGHFSKSRNIGVFGDDAKATGIAADVWRYYIIVNRPEKTDTEFIWEDFQAKLNKELIANFGNLVNRTITFTNRFFNNQVPNFKPDKTFLKKVQQESDKVTELMSKIQLKESLRKIMAISKLANQYFQENEPWKNKDTAPNTIATLINVVKDLSILISPFLPQTSASIQQQLNIKDLTLKDLNKISIKKSHKINKAKVLFQKLEDKDMQKFRKMFAGKKTTEKFPLNLKVAKITDVKQHPKADKLYILKVNLGKEKRQLVAGLKGYYTKDQLKNKNLIVVTNLKPAKLRGIESQGMLLAGIDKKKNVGILTTKAKPGTQINPENLKNNTSEITFEEFKKIKLKIRDSKVYYNNLQLKQVTVEKVKNGHVE